MLSDALILSLSRNFWDEVWRSRHQVMSRLSRRNQVVFVSRPLMLHEAAPWAPAAPTLRQPGGHRVHDNLCAYVPPAYLPSVFSMPSLERVFDAGRRAALRRFTRRWRGKPGVLYLWHPSFEPYIDAFPDSVVCYHLFDDLGAYGQGRKSTVEATLERIFARADLVFTSSSDLAARYQQAGKTYWIPNGVDYDAYAAAETAPIPDDLASVQGVRLGYAGTLRNQIDVGLLTAIAQARPGWSIVLIGDVSRDMAASGEFSTFAALPNVHRLGQKDTAEMPAYMRHLDVGLLPYRLDGAARYCYPLKMHEYLAAGIPVVSSRISAVEGLEAVVRVADSTADWIAAIEQSHNPSDAASIAGRRRVARDNSWDHRVARISELIADRVAARRQEPR